MNPIIQAYPELPRWRSSLLGRIAVAAEVLGFILIKLFEMGLWGPLSRRAPEHLGYRIFMACFALFLLSAPLGIAGILLDKKKVLSIFVLATFLPALVFLLLWSGYW